MKFKSFVKTTSINCTLLLNNDPLSVLEIRNCS